MLGLVDWWRRRRAARAPFAERWREVLRARVPFYPRFEAAARARFEDKLKVFLLTKHFVPAGGLEITLEMQLVVSAAAARLSMNLPGEHYGSLTEIVLYPSTYVHPDGGVIFGEAHRRGTVVLSWDAVLQGVINSADGHDTAVHELAHVLDVADGHFDGTPVLASCAAFGPWAQVMSKEYLRLRAQKGRTVLRRYGATNEAEFFAVAVETFFEKPRQMKQRHPELYELLAGHFRLDPLAELEASREGDGAEA